MTQTFNLKLNLRINWFSFSIAYLYLLFFRIIAKLPAAHLYKDNKKFITMTIGKLLSNAMQEVIDPGSNSKNDNILVCKGCGHRKDIPIKLPALACCPDSNYIPLNVYLINSKYVEPKTGQDQEDKKVLRPINAREQIILDNDIRP